MKYNRKEFEMTVRDLLDLMPGRKDVCIKPGGRREYFFGRAEDAPESLMNVTVTEIQAKEGGELGIWVDAIEEWDAMVDAFPGISETPAIADNIYYDIMADHERWVNELKDGIEKAREKRKYRYQTERPDRKRDSSKERHFEDYLSPITPINIEPTKREDLISEETAKWLAENGRSLESID